jgi:hypothetical protein
MDAREFFHDVVRRNYDEFCASQTFKPLWNGIVSMNTVAEFVALHRLQYPPISRGDLANEAAQVRDSILLDLKFCAETFKHVRKIEDSRASGFTSIATSTGVDTSKPATWIIEENGKPHDLVRLLHDAFALLRGFPELI